MALSPDYLNNPDPFPPQSVLPDTGDPDADLAMALARFDGCHYTPRVRAEMEQVRIALADRERRRSE